MMFHKSHFSLASKREKYFADVESETGTVDDLFSAASPENSDGWSTERSDSVEHALVGPVSFGMLERLPIEDQATWILPAIPMSKKVERLLAAPESTDLKGYHAYLRRLLKSTGIYALASLTGPFIALALAPFLTHRLSHSDYGTLAVLSTTIALVAGLTQLGLGSAFFRAYNYDYETPEDRAAVLSTVLALLLLCSLPVVGAVMLTAPWLAAVLLDNAGLGACIQLAVLVVLAQNLTVPGFAWMRAENRASYFAILSIANLLVTSGMTIGLVGGLSMGIAGALLATGGGYGLVALCTLPSLVVRAGISWRLDVARGLLSFGLPNVSNFVAAWVLQLADRFLLAHLRSFSEAALYAVAYNLGGVLSVVILAPFSLAWPATLFTIAKRDDAPRVFQLIFRWYSLLLLFMAYALTLAGIATLDLFFPPAYVAALPVIPIVALSTLLYGIYNYLTLGIGIRRKTWLAVLFVSLSALVNIGCNLLLIPLYGSLGAAIATLVAYFVLALITYLVNQRIYPVAFEVCLFGIAALLTLWLYAAANWLAQGQSFYAAWGIQVGALCVCGAALFILGKLWKCKG